MSVDISIYNQAFLTAQQAVQKEKCKFNIREHSCYQISLISGSKMSIYIFVYVCLSVCVFVWDRTHLYYVIVIPESTKMITYYMRIST